jgi:hypothetical protein
MGDLPPAVLVAGGERSAAELVGALVTVALDIDVEELMLVLVTGVLVNVGEEDWSMAEVDAATPF